MQQAGKYRRAANGLYLAMPQQQMCQADPIMMIPTRVRSGYGVL